MALSAASPGSPHQGHCGVHYVRYEPYGGQRLLLTSRTARKRGRSCVNHLLRSERRTAKKVRTSGPAAAIRGRTMRRSSSRTTMRATRPPRIPSALRQLHRRLECHWDNIPAERAASGVCRRNRQSCPHRAWREGAFPLLGRGHLQKLKEDNKEFLPVPSAGHTDLYDQVDIISFGRITEFFDANLRD